MRYKDVLYYKAYTAWLIIGILLPFLLGGCGNDEDYRNFVDSDAEKTASLFIGNTYEIGSLNTSNTNLDLISIPHLQSYDTSSHYFSLKNISDLFNAEYDMHTPYVELYRFSPEVLDVFNQLQDVFDNLVFGAYLSVININSITTNDHSFSILDPKKGLIDHALVDIKKGMIADLNVFKDFSRFYIRFQFFDWLTTLAQIKSAFGSDTAGYLEFIQNLINTNKKAQLVYYVALQRGIDIVPGIIGDFYSPYFKKNIEYYINLTFNDQFFFDNHIKASIFPDSLKLTYSNAKIWWAYSEDYKMQLPFMAYFNTADGTMDGYLPVLTLLNEKKIKAAKDDSIDNMIFFQNKTSGKFAMFYQKIIYRKNKPSIVRLNINGKSLTIQNINAADHNIRNEANNTDWTCLKFQENHNDKAENKPVILLNQIPEIPGIYTKGQLLSSVDDVRRILTIANRYKWCGVSNWQIPENNKLANFLNNVFLTEGEHRNFSYFDTLDYQSLYSASFDFWVKDLFYSNTKNPVKQTYVVADKQFTPLMPANTALPTNFLTPSAAHLILIGSN